MPRGLHILAATIMIGFMTACSTTTRDELSLTPVTFNDLPEWSDEQASRGLHAFRQSCTVAKQAPLRAYNTMISLQQWWGLCKEAQSTKDALAKAFFETYFVPHRTMVDGNHSGLLTGYYTPLLQGSLTKDATYNTPIYRLPDHSKQTQHTRSDIDDGALAGKGLEILWLDNPVDAFFLHIQGSAYVNLTDGSTRKLVFAGRNTHPYTAIGHHFIDRGIVLPEDMSMQWLRRWLAQHPDEAATIMQTNASYIFFALEPNALHIKGAEGSDLTPMHSIAVDPVFLTYGIPIYLHTTGGKHNLSELTIAQDTGSAIKGGLRADLYTGIGESAENLAGSLKAPVSFYTFLPRPL